MATSSSARPILAGLCSRAGGYLGWNPWGLRAAFLVLLAVMPLAAIGGYLGGVLLLEWFGPEDERRCRRHRDAAAPGRAWRRNSAAGEGDEPTTFTSPELAERAARIEALKRRIDAL